MEDSASLHHLLPTFWRSKLREYIESDIPSFDFAGFVVGDAQEEAFLLSKSPGILAGSPFFTAVVEEAGCQIEWDVVEGAQLTGEKTRIARVTGPCNAILQAERTALNILTRASGIATQAHEIIRTVRNAGYKGEIAGTRKTTPGFRMVEKYSLLVAGASTHRMDLSSMIMLKDNHVWSAGSITSAVQKARRAGGFSIKIEVECRTIEEAIEAAEAGAEILMLDNYTPERLKEEATRLKEMFPYLCIEASGGITHQSIVEYLCDSVDVYSLGCLTQGYPTLDFSLKISKGIKSSSN